MCVCVYEYMFVCVCVFMNVCGCVCVYVRGGGESILKTEENACERD